MKWRLKADKAKMYSLVSEYLDIPPIEQIYYNSGEEICWMEYCEKISGHYVMARLNWNYEKAWLSFSDLTVGWEMRIINIAFNDVIEKGLIEEIEGNRKTAYNARIENKRHFWLIGCLGIVCFMVWLVYR